MTSGQDLVIALNETQKQLNKCILYLKKSGKVQAKRERNYKVALRQEVFKLHDSGVAWTACIELAKGDVEVAELRCKRDTIVSYMETCKEKINVLKTELKILTNEIMAERQGL